MEVKDGDSRRSCFLVIKVRTYQFGWRCLRVFLVYFFLEGKRVSITTFASAVIVRLYLQGGGIHV